MDLSSNYNEFLEILREKCKTQRKLMNYSQEKVCQILEERYKLGEIEKTYDVEDFILVESPYPWFPRTYYIRQKHNEKISKYGYYMKDLFKQSSGIKDFIKLYTPVICIDYSFKKANLVHSIRIPLTGSDRDDAYASLHITLKLFSPEDYKMTLATCASLKNEYGWKVDEYMSNGGDFYKRSCSLSEDNKPIIDYKQVDFIPLHSFKYWNLIVL